MKKFYLLGILLLLAATLMTPSVTLAADAKTPTLSVSGQGSAQGVPDQATIALGVTTHSLVAKDAQEQNNSISEGLRSALEEFGIDKRDIQTENYNFSPEYSYDEAQRGSITGYTVNNTVLVRIHDIEKTGQIIDVALANGANNVHSLEFSIRDPRPLRQEALTAAVKDVREKADSIAKALGRRIIGIASVSENTPFLSPHPMERMMAGAAMMDFTPIEAGTLTLTADVRVEFLLAD